MSRHDSHRNDVEVQVGQIWEDRDPRRARRRIQIERIEPSTAANVGPLAWVRSLDTGRHSFLAVSHLRAVSDRKGWTYVSDAQPTESASSFNDPKDPVL